MVWFWHQQRVVTVSFFRGYGFFLFLFIEHTNIQYDWHSLNDHQITHQIRSIDPCIAIRLNLPNYIRSTNRKKKYPIHWKTEKKHNERRQHKDWIEQWIYCLVFKLLDIWTQIDIFVLDSVCHVLKNSYAC